jgi:UDP-N-acetylmuramoyl-L-alanyl-D-glutamate--2,6-diaminopimelate ligase
VVNADDPGAAGLVNRFDGPVLTVGIDQPAEINAVLVEQFPSEQTFLLSAGSETIPVRTRMIGAHHVSNCLVAAAVGLTYGIDLPTIARGLESVGHVPGRLERIECGQPFGVFVDYAHTPDALAAALDTLRPLVEGRLICVFGAGGDRDHAKRPLMARAVEPRADMVVLTSDNPRSEDPREIIEDVFGGFLQPQSVRIAVDRRKAIRTALAAAAPGDCVLIAGKGHERVQIVGEEEIPFDDAEVAHERVQIVGEEEIPFDDAEVVRDWLYEVRPYAEVGN